MCFWQVRDMFLVVEKEVIVKLISESVVFGVL